MAQPRRRLAAVLVALAVLALAACGGGRRVQSSTTVPTRPAGGSVSTGTAAGPGPSTVQWSACQGAAGPQGYQCATVSVPRDPSHPGGATIPMAIDRHPATGQKIGSLLVNPGGPGVSGVDFLPQIVAEMPAELLARFDIVGFDPPGVGRTAPITCLDGSALEQYFHTDPAPPSSAGFAALVAADRGFAAGCEAKSGAELPYVSTVDAARDMDVVRAALGDATLTYMGFSYGTLLGATYANLFPTHIRAMVLDGAIDPALAPVPQLDQQSAALDGQLQQFFSDCSRAAACPWHPAGDPATAYNALLARVRADPLRVKGTSRQVGPAEVLYGTAAALYSTSTWNDLSQALEEASQGNGAAFLALFDAYSGRQSNGTYSNLFEANAAINCLDAPPLPLSAIQSDAPAAQAASPVFGLTNLYGEVECSVWPVPATGHVGPLPAPGSPPIVVVGSTGDPITPYSWAQALAQELGRGVLLTRVGDGHTGYGNSACVRGDVDRYLIDLTPPASGTRCPSN